MRISERLVGATSLLIFFSSAANAAEKTAGHAKKGGLPQLDPATFSSQIFWLALTFLLLFLIIWKVALPKIVRVVEDRREAIERDLDRATEVRNEAEGVLADYEAAIAEGRANAQSIVRAAAGEMAEKASAEHSKQGETLAGRIGEAETRIAAAKSDAIKNVQDVAADIVQVAAEKLMDLKVAKKDASAAVGAVTKDRARS